MLRTRYRGCCVSMKNDAYRVVIVGAGAIAGGYDMARARADAGALTHAGAYAAHDGFEVIACVDPDEERRGAFQRHWNVPHAFASLDDYQASGVVADVASICSPTARHAADLSFFVDRPERAVFCEKPITPDLKQAEALVAAYAADKIFMVNHPRRWCREIIKLGEDIRSGRFGALQTASAYYGKGILHNGSHMIDLLHSLLGEINVNSVGASRYDYEPGDPTVDAVLETASGSPVYLMGTDSRLYDMFEVAFVFDSVAISLENGCGAMRVRAVVKNPLAPTHRVADRGEWSEIDLTQAMPAAVQNLYECLAHKAAPLCDGQTALKAQALCEKIRGMAI